MKKILLSFLTAIFYLSITLAQSPSGFKYQAVARDNHDQPIANRSVSVRISFLESQNAMNAIYSEMHSVTTSKHGLFALHIGKGNPLFNQFSQLDWTGKQYYMKVDLDPGGNNNFTHMGTAPLLSVPYALHAKSADNINDPDPDPSNELQTLLYDPTTQTLTISKGNSVNLPTGGSDADGDPQNEIQQLSYDPNTNEISISGGNKITLPDMALSDGDRDATNEFQNLSFDPLTNEISITNGNKITIPNGGPDADADPQNELQSLSFDGKVLSINKGNSVELSALKDGVNDADADPTNEIQNLSFDPNTNTLSIAGGNAISIPTGGTDADADPQNEIQQLTFDPATNELSISNGNKVAIPTGGTDADADPQNEIQTLSKSGSTVTLSNNGGAFTDETEDADADPKNEIQQLAFDASTKKMSISGGNEIDLAILQDGVNDADPDPQNEIQQLTFDPATNELSISNGNKVAIPTGGTDADADPQNEIQTLSKSGSTVTLSNSGGSFTDETEDADADPKNEIQQLAFDASTKKMSISGGNEIDLAILQDGVNDADPDPQNEIQQLTFDPATNELSISNGNKVAIPTGGTDADADPQNEIQTLSKSGSTVTLSNSGGSFTDETEDADADPNNEIQQLTFDPATNELSISNGNKVAIPTGGTDADADPQNEIQTLSKSGSTVTLSNNGGAFTDETEDADADPQNEIQQLTFDPATNELSISNGNKVAIPTGGTDADADPQNEIQTLSKSGSTVTLSNNGGAFTDETEDADADPKNEIQQLAFDASTKKMSISGGNEIDLAVLQDGVDDADANPRNEIQTLSKSGSTVTLSSNGGSFTDETDDADADPANEIQSLSFDATTNELSISGSNKVTLPAGGADADADPKNELQQLSFDANNNKLSISGGNDIDLTGALTPWKKVSKGISYQDKAATVESSSSSEKFSIMPTGIEGGDGTKDTKWSAAKLEFNPSGNTDYVSLEAEKLSFLDLNNNAIGSESSVVSRADLQFRLTSGLVGNPTNYSHLNARNLHFDYELDNGKVKLVDLSGEGLIFNPDDPTIGTSWFNQDSLFFTGSQFFTNYTASLKNNALKFESSSGIANYSTQYGVDGVKFSDFNYQTNIGLNLISMKQNLGISNIVETLNMTADGLKLYGADQTERVHIGTDNLNNNTRGLIQLFQENKQGPTVSIDGGIPAGGGQLRLLDGEETKISLAALANTGYMEVYGPSGKLNFSIQTTNSPNRGAMQVHDETGQAKAGIDVDDSDQGRVWTIGKLSVAKSATEDWHTIDYLGHSILDDQGLETAFLGRDLFNSSLGILALNGANGLSRNIVMGGNFEDNYMDGGLVALYDNSFNVRTGIKVDGNNNGEFFVKDGQNQYTTRIGENQWELYKPGEITPAIRLTRDWLNDNAGDLRVFGQNGSGNFVATYDQVDGNGSLGYAAVMDQNGDRKAGMRVDHFSGTGVLFGDQVKSTEVRVEGPSSTNVYLGYSGNDTDNGLLHIRDQSDTPKAGMYIDANGKGVIFGDIKNFAVPHPRDNSKEIWYASLEGPESAAYTRGTATLSNGEAFVPFPEHFKLIASTPGMTVILTPLSADTYGLAVVEKTRTGIRVKELKGGSGNFSFDWEVKCVRTGFENFEIIRDKR